MTHPRRFRRGIAAGLLAVAGGSGLLVAGASLAAPVPPLQLPDTIAQRVQACTACHGKEGRATNQGYFPRIAGKPAGYLFHQLVNFRDGRRQNDTMAHLVAWMSDDYLREIAGYFAALDLPYPPPAPAPAPDGADVSGGERLVHLGDPARRIPACVACHGPSMTGVAPAVPGLLGLPRDYVIAQFGAWRTGQRRAAAPDCMEVITTRLAAADIGAVATWLAAQPVPAHAAPAASGAVAERLPLECGSVADR